MYIHNTYASISIYLSMYIYIYIHNMSLCIYKNRYTYLPEYASLASLIPTKYLKYT